MFEKFLRKRLGKKADSQAVTDTANPVFEWSNWKPGNSELKVEVGSLDWMNKALAYFTFPLPDISHIDLPQLGEFIRVAIATGEAERTTAKKIASEFGISDEAATRVGHAFVTYAYSVPDSLDNRVVAQNQEWLAGCCETCDVNDGETRKVGESFPSGHLHPPACGYCTCTLAPSLDD